MLSIYIGTDKSAIFDAFTEIASTTSCGETSRTIGKVVDTRAKGASGLKGSNEPTVDDGETGGATTIVFDGSSLVRTTLVVELTSAPPGTLVCVEVFFGTVVVEPTIGNNGTKAGI